MLCTPQVGYMRSLSSHADDVNRQSTLHDCPRIDINLLTGWLQTSSWAVHGGDGVGVLPRWHPVLWGAQERSVH